VTRRGGVVHAIEWRDGTVRILDQTKLPGAESYLDLRGADDVARAIRALAVRGAPLLGIAAAYGLALAAARSSAGGPRGLLRDLARAERRLLASRPTAVNIRWALARARAAAEAAAIGGEAEAVRFAVLQEAHLIAREDELSCRAIGERGARLIPAGANVLTHCNTGGLATGGTGTALGVILAAHRGGKRVHVWVSETRPLLQGSRLTAWELGRFAVPHSVIVDGAAGSLMARGMVDVVVVGADRIAANGDVANKVGTYQLAVLARHHGLPLYVAAPFSTVDASVRTGREIAIEERDPSEVVSALGVRIAPEGTAAANPAFDVTPAALVSAVITDRGTVRRPFGASLARLGRAAGPRMPSLRVDRAGRGAASAAG
jgi:methylthioribose-1-phosphate isomerase